MAIAEVIKFEGPQDALVWKFPIEDFNATSQLIVDETHEALLVVNGNAADLFTAGRRTLSVPNIPIARTLIEIPTGGNSPFPCKVFFINKVHAMDLLWGTQGPIALEDPLYDIFMHVMANGSMSVSVENSRKFMLKIVGFRDRFTPDDLIAKFRGIISSHVKDCISKIMINGMLSYFMMNAHLFELSGVIKERLDKVFEEYGVRIEFFNIETIEVPEADYKKLLIPHRECVHNGMCKDGCDFKLRSGADFVASRLVNTLLYDVADKTAFVKLLVQLDRPILEVLKDNPTITPSVRLSNCIKIKFLRKALLVKSFGITKAEYEMILKHPNFLKGGSRDA